MSLVLLARWLGPVAHELYQDDKRGEGRGAWHCTCGARTPCQHHLEAQAKASKGLLSNRFTWTAAGLDLAARCRCAGAAPVALTPEPARGVANVAQGVGGLAKNGPCPCAANEARFLEGRGKRILKKCTGDAENPHPIGVPPGYGPEREIIGGGSPPRKPTRAERARERRRIERVERGRERVFRPARVEAAADRARRIDELVAERRRGAMTAAGRFELEVLRAESRAAKKRGAK